MEFSWPLVLVLGVLVLYGEQVKTCFCPRSHPQTDFCHLSSFAIVGTVNAVTENTKDRRFNVTLRHMLKVPDNYIVTDNDQIQLISHKGSTLCELEVERGLTYVITGYVTGEVEYLVNSCLWTENFKTLSFSKFNGLLGNYDCSCYINDWGLTPVGVTPRDVCDYDETSTCEQAACKRNEQGSCEWILNCTEQKRASSDLSSLKEKIRKEINEIL
ncbi:uncharacterized protein [Argopecten irradians]|uniref:uncharacterized protein n=1 Tax=Argopecten irradians TaxID=31199 RepID=UPI0037109084